MEEIKNEKLTYEQLEQAAHQLSQQNKQLYGKLQEANMFNIFKRLDYLFKVVENASAFSSDFVVKCVEEIEGTITLPEKTEVQPEEEILKEAQ
jgi:hypothetical protein